MSETTSKSNGASGAEPQDSQKHLDEALSDLDNLRTEKYILVDDFLSPSAVARKTARRILEEIVPSFPRNYGVFPEEKYAIVIMPIDSDVHIFCDSDGSVSVFVYHLDGAENGRDELHSPTPDDAVMKFIRKAMEKFK